MKHSLKENLEIMKRDSVYLANASLEDRNLTLLHIIENLISDADIIFKANQKDLAAANENQIAESIIKRLKFDESKLQTVIDGIKDLISLPDPIGKIEINRQLSDTLKLCRISVPIGVIGVIFEARPDALIQISALCIKSGNMAILKGGSETTHTNKALYASIHRAVKESVLPDSSIYLIEARSDVAELLAFDKYVDLLIPRGSNAFVQYIMNHTKIPVMGHADGICHTYIDRSADIAKSIHTVIDAKTQYTAACNATESLLIHKDIATEILPPLADALHSNKVKIHATKEVADIIPDDIESILEEENFSHEYLDLEIGIKLVENIEEAISHINAHGSHHTDAILTEDDKAAETFLRFVDSAGVYHNTSTRFADGFRYGFGAEVGISTSKLHARGPVGLEGLCTYKYKLSGQYDKVGEYASGAKKFEFKDKI